MRLVVLAAAAAVLVCPAHPTPPPPVADPICVTVDPVFVMGQEVVPAIQECAPVA